MKHITAVSMKMVMFFVVCLLFLSGCAPLITTYDDHIYKRATSLKVESRTLLNKATEPYSKHQQKAEKLQMDLNKVHEYVKGISLNEESTAQWAIISSPKKHSIAGVLERWKKDETLTSGFIKEAGAKIDAGFDEIIKLESRKLKPSHLQ